MSFFPYSFEAVIVRHGVGRDRKLWYSVVFLPEDIAAAMPFAQHPQLRVEGELADLPFKAAFLSAGEGRYYMMVSPKMLKEAGLRLGQGVEVRFRIADQDEVDVPEELDGGLADDAEAAAAWDDLTPGRRRALSHFVGSAKTDPTRARRVLAVLAAITDRKPPPSIADDVKRLSRVLGKKAG